MQRRARRALTAFLVLTLGILVSFLVVWLSPAVSLADVYEVGPGTYEPSLIVSLALLWCLVGTVLWWLSRRAVTSDTLVLLVGAVVISLFYLTVLREHVWFGDIELYVRAAKVMSAGAEMTGRYVYPPFWAFFLSTIYRVLGGGVVGDGAIILTCFVLNHLSTVGFFVLGSLFLSRCGLSRTFSSLLLLAAMLVSAPILRNMVYVQVNLLLVDLILGGVLVFRRSVLLSAMMFAVATHLKVVPVLFIPVFLYRREYRWVIYYGLFLAGIAWVTTLTGGIGYYRVFLENLTQWHPASLRSSSFYGFFKRTDMLLRAQLPFNALFNVTRVILTLWVYALSYVSIRREAFVAGSTDSRSAALINGLVPLMFLWPATSPTVWPYHLVVLIIPAILTLVCLRGRRRLGLWGLGYFFTFLLPVFDFYPWSYLRLVGWLALLAALSDTVLSPRTSRWVERLDRVVCERVRAVADEVTAIVRGVRAT